MMKGRGLRALAGALIVVVLAALSYFGTRAALGAYSPKYVVTVVLGESGQGIVPGSDVSMRGVLVGQVGEITLTDEFEAAVELVLEPVYAIPERATFAVTGKTLLGEKQIEVFFDGPLTEGELVADGSVIDDPERVVELQDVLADLDRLLSAIHPDDLATVVSDGLGAFEGQELEIARAVDQGARATGLFAQTLDDQVPALEDLSLVAEELGPRGEEFNRLGAALALNLDTLTDNQQRLRVLEDELLRFADRLNRQLVVDRAELDRMIIDGDNVTRMLFVYRPELGQTLVGLADYFDVFVPAGFQDPTIRGQAARFQILIDSPFTHLCHELPTELASELPVCGPESRSAPLPAPDLPAVGAPPTAATASVAAPQDPARLGLDELFAQTLSGIGDAAGASDE